MLNSFIFAHTAARDRDSAIALIAKYCNGSFVIDETSNWEAILHLVSKCKNRPFLFLYSTSGLFKINENIYSLFHPERVYVIERKSNIWQFRHVKDSQFVLENVLQASLGPPLEAPKFFSNGHPELQNEDDYYQPRSSGDAASPVRTKPRLRPVVTARKIRHFVLHRFL